MKRAGKDNQQDSDAQQTAAGGEEFLTSDRGLSKKILKEGKGATVPDDVTVVVHYIGRLKDGTIFDESYKRKKPFEFRIGKRNVILGWDLGVKSMKIGETAILTCAPDYAYGNRAIGPIPANSTLYFEVELLDWKKGEDDNLIYLVVVLAVLTGVFVFVFNHLYPKVTPAP